MTHVSTNSDSKIEIRPAILNNKTSEASSNFEIIIDFKEISSESNSDRGPALETVVTRRLPYYLFSFS